MELFAAQIVNGLALGSIYVLLVTGFNLLLIVGRVIQFAYPQFVVLSMYALWGVIKYNGNFLLAGLTAIVVSVFLNLLSEPLFRRINNIKGIDINISFVASLGLGLVIVEVMSHSINHGFPVSFPLEWTGGAVVRTGLISISRGELLSFVIGVVVVMLLFYLLYRTRAGRVFRAVAENRYMARLVGIPISKLSRISYLTAGLLGGIIAILFSMLLGSASPWLGEFVALKVLAVSIVAGLGNLRGGLVVGLLLGIIEALAMGYFAGSWSNVIAFIVMLTTVLTRPQGLFGMKISGQPED